MRSSASGQVTVTVAGIRNCDTCRKARRWLEAGGIPCEFLDVRTAGIDHDTIDDWADALGPETLLNRRGHSWRALPPERRENLDDDAIRTLLAEQPLLIRRPVLLVAGEAVAAGFDASRWSEMLQQYQVPWKPDASGQPSTSSRS